MIVVWRVTQRCDLGCPFCAYDRHLPGRREEADPAEVLRFGAVLADYQRIAGDRVLVSWMGGEPLRWPPLSELTVRFTRDLGLQVSATTNGTTLGSPAVRRHLLEHYTELTVSVDGLGSVHDELRRWPGGFATLHRGVTTLAAEKRAAGRGPQLRVNVVLLRDTVADFGRLCLELAEWGVEAITFNQLGGHDRPEFHPAHRLLPEQVEKLAAELPGLRQQLAERGVHLSGGEGYLRRFRASARAERLPIADCGPGERFWFVDEQGRLAPCSFTAPAYGVPIEEVVSVAGLRQVLLHFREAQRHRRLAPCADCHSTQVFGKFAA